MLSKEYIYTLEKGSKKHRCPNCTKKTFVKYIDTTTSKYLPNEFGRCDRESKCGYHLNPYTSNYNTEKVIDYSKNYQKTKTPKKELVFIPKEILNKTLNNYQQNTFINNLLKSYSNDKIQSVIAMYYLGTISKGYRKNGITFPFIDSNYNIRAIQVKQFDKHNHTTSTDFIHSIINEYFFDSSLTKPNWLKNYKENDKIVSCLFGEHLLKQYPKNPIGLVEAPKTTIYATLHFGKTKQQTDLLWLAVYNLSSLNFEKCKVLKGRTVVLFPDTCTNGTAFNLWTNKAKELNKKIPTSNFIVSDLLENNATKQEKEKGYDLADYLCRFT